MMNFCRVVWIFMIMFLIISCGGEKKQPQSLGPKFSSIQSQVFTPTCAQPQCHKGANVESQLDLEEGAAYNNLVNRKSDQVPDLYLVNPDSAAASYLVHKLEGGKIVGDRMPLGRKPLGPDTLQAIITWINQGAQNN